ncbi:60S ribosomal protein L29 [Drechslerella dactyloides]|uniref:60S ribosomal protein L29 n=1 Tax=Drechslerella dactyloides TaxID=74499 RepID=A0AAD6J2P6_DREDA|nr:60S ribosomal protein L29 [Drechslerella dactyloides]
MTLQTLIDGSHSPECRVCFTSRLSKNSSQHNQSRKAHRNGIKKPKTFRYPSLKGTDPKFRRNHKHALHGTAKALKEFRAGERENA